MNRSESKYFRTAVIFDKALLSLLEKKSFEYITISELCKEAGVNRSTFYLHYESMEDLLRETTEYVLECFQSYFSAETKNIVGAFAKCDLQSLVFINSKYLRPYLAYIRDHQRLFTAAMMQPEVFRFDAAYNRLFVRVFEPIMERFRYPVEERNYAMRFYINGITAVTMEWVQDGCQKSIEEIISIIHHCIFGAWGQSEIKLLLENAD